MVIRARTSLCICAKKKNAPPLPDRTICPVFFVALIAWCACVHVLVRVRARARFVVACDCARVCGQQTMMTNDKKKEPKVSADDNGFFHGR